MNILLIKVALMPVVMAIVTQASRKWGNRIGGLISSMPWIAGPILLFFILEQGKLFGIQSVPGILTGIVSLIGFCYSYARLSARFSWLPTLLLSYSVYVLVALLLNQIRVNLWLGYGMAMGSILLCLRVFPAPAAQPSSIRRLPYDMLIRMGVATLFVIAITELAHWVGPTWSGVLTPFPVITSILAVFTHFLQGSSGVVTLLRGSLLGFLGYTTFLFLQAFLLTDFSIGVSFLIALLVNVLISVAVSRLV
ncbi:hypothetical protein [Spirosoma sp. KUDC1026]|uniref:hypothetical protein n=1 Tax=Spirosoma sp. KUDC1026 TaxID=2745947 RepID=UPI00159BC9BA|nr:hypothetical protein [Spirosoma sp. KUDC1026]QKZ13438.1 hypothetical protein HU175_12655 [Spirosoma sp. KUDC1026]